MNILIRIYVYMHTCICIYREKLQKDLGVANLPAHMCDEEIRPLMCKQVYICVFMYIYMCIYIIVCVKSSF
jgi:hypothetical protein